jgi:hypothetical protein
MKTLWFNIIFIFFFLLFTVILDYLLAKSTLAITLSDIFFIFLAIIVYSLLFFPLKEYLFDKSKMRNKTFTKIELPLWKLLSYTIFFLILLVIGIYMSYVGIMNPLEQFKVKGGLQHGYSIACFGSGFTLLMLIFNIAFLWSIFVKRNGKE